MGINCKFIPKKMLGLKANIKMSEMSSDSSELNFDALREKYEIGPDTIIGPNFITLDKLGSGSFGQIFLGQTLSGDLKVAIKFEPNRDHTAQLFNEKRVYELLGEHIGFPKMYWFGQYGRYNVLVIDLLGKNLEEVFQACDRKFSTKTVVYIAIQLLDRFQYIHSKHIAYRDVKPENFLLGYPGKPTANIVHVVDFGLSKYYIDPYTGLHIPYREGKNLTGTARYMSINAHYGIEQSRRDDLEALGHLFIYFLRDGILPWSGLKAATLKERYKKIGEIKQTWPVSRLCRNFPKLFADYLEYTRNLEFDEEPDYDEWKRNFQILYNQYRDETFTFEWEGRFHP